MSLVFYFTITKAELGWTIDPLAYPFPHKLHQESICEEAPRFGVSDVVVQIASDSC
jgi:hypothetical protein